MKYRDDDLDALDFGAVEKDIYIDPPKTGPNTPEDVKVLLWKDWQKREARRRGAHKAAFTRRQKAQAPNYEVNPTVYKSGGVYRQRSGLVGIDGNEESLEQILTVPATQDRHFQARGTRAGKCNKSNRRRNKKKLKTQRILSKGKVK